MKIKRALLSVSDKTGIVKLAQFLHDIGVEIISTGGTMTAIKEAGIPVTYVSDVTGFPEIMDGRVKTLNPKIHGGILAVRSNPEHMAALENIISNRSIWSLSICILLKRPLQSPMLRKQKLSRISISVARLWCVPLLKFP